MEKGYLSYHGSAQDFSSQSGWLVSRFSGAVIPSTSAKHIEKHMQRVSEPL